MAPLAPMKTGMSLTTVKATVFSLGRGHTQDHHVKNIKPELSQICYPECLKLILYCSHCFKKKKITPYNFTPSLAHSVAGSTALGHSQCGQVVCIGTVFKARSRFIHKDIYSTIEKFTSSDRIIFNIVTSRRVQLRHMSFSEQWSPLAPNSTTFGKPMNIVLKWLILGVPC